MFLLIVFSCGSSSHDTASDELLDLTVSLAVPESGYQITTPSFEVPAYEEIEICTVIRAGMGMLSVVSRSLAVS